MIRYDSISDRFLETENENCLGEDYITASCQHQDRVHQFEFAVCKYKNGDIGPFLITKLYCSQDGLGGWNYYFDAICLDGSTITDGTLSLVELFTPNEDIRHGFIVLFENMIKVMKMQAKSIPVRRRSRKRCSGARRR